MRWLCLILFLSACIPIRDDVLQSYDGWRGTTTFTTQESAFGVFTNIRRRDANCPRIGRITSGGQTLDYTAHDRLLTHCIDGCQPAEVGVITLGETAFRLAAQAGLPLRVWGLRGRYDGTVPAEAFARVLAKVDDG